MSYFLLRPKTRYLMDLQKEWKNNIIIYLLPYKICHLVYPIHFETKLNNF